MPPSRFFATMKPQSLGETVLFSVMNVTTARPRSLYAIDLVVVGGVYFAAARFGLSLTTVNEFAAFIWPAAGIGLAALYVRGQRLWPAIALATFAANFTTGAPLLAALAIATGNTLEALAGA